MARIILKIHKTKATPKRFQGKAGLPSKNLFVKGFTFISDPYRL